jgi:hypothetical protein
MVHVEREINRRIEETECAPYGTLRGTGSPLVMNAVLLVGSTPLWMLSRKFHQRNLGRFSSNFHFDMFSVPTIANNHCSGAYDKLICHFTAMNQIKSIQAWSRLPFTELHAVIRVQNSQRLSCIAYHKNYYSSTGRFLPLLTGLRLCSSWRPVHRWLQGASEFCQWIYMPVGR